MGERNCSQFSQWSHRRLFILLLLLPTSQHDRVHHHGNRLNSEAAWVKHHSADIYHPLRLYGLMMGNHERLDLVCVCVC